MFSKCFTELSSIKLDSGFTNSFLSFIYTPQLQRNLHIVNMLPNDELSEKLFSTLHCLCPLSGLLIRQRLRYEPSSMKLHCSVCFSTFSIKQSISNASKCIEQTISHRFEAVLIRSSDQYAINAVERVSVERCIFKRGLKKSNKQSNQWSFLAYCTSNLNTMKNKETRQFHLYA